MRTAKLLVGLLFAFSASAWAQTYPKIEVSAGYVYLRFNPSIGPSANCSGGYGSVGVNFNDWFGVVGDVDGCKTTGPAPNTNGSATTFLFGPKFAYRKCCLLTPFGQVLVGGAHGSAGFPGLTNSATSFAFAAGGGVDYKPWHSCLFAIRVVEVDYLLTRFNGANQNNFQFKTGIVLRWW